MAPTPPYGKDQGKQANSDRIYIERVKEMRMGRKGYG
jgi:hypothetical protein